MVHSHEFARNLDQRKAGNTFFDSAHTLEGWINTALEDGRLRYDRPNPKDNQVRMCKQALLGYISCLALDATTQLARLQSVRV